MYYLSLKFVNSGSKLAVAYYKDLEGKPKFVDVYPGSTEDKTMVSSTEQPPNVDITALDKETKKPLMLNSVPLLTVTPKDVDELVTINIGQGT